MYNTNSIWNQTFLSIINLLTNFYLFFSTFRYNMTCVGIPDLVQLKNMQKVHDSHRRKVDELLNQKMSSKAPFFHYNPLIKIDKDEIEQVSLLVKNVKINQISLNEQHQTLKQTVEKLVGQIEESQKYLDEATKGKSSYYHKYLCTNGSAMFVAKKCIKRQQTTMKQNLYSTFFHLIHRKLLGV